MAGMTFSNPGVGKLFQGIAGALAGPDPSTLIEADLNRVRRDGMLVENDINTQKLGTLKRQEAAMHQLADVLGDPTLAQTPEGRASLMSILSQVPDGLQYGPKFATGAASFTDPNFVEGDGDFSRILAGTGVADWTNTPTGQERDLANKLEIAKMGDQNDLAIALLGGGPNGRTPLDVSPKDTEDITAQLEDAISAQYPGAGIDPQTMQAMIARAAQVYQQTRNASAAVRQAIVDAKLEQGASSWNPGLLPWDWFRSQPGEVGMADGSPLTDVLSGGAGAITPPNLTPDPTQQVAPGVNPAVVEAPTVPDTTPPAQNATPEGVTLPQVHFNADGSAFMVHRGRNVTIIDGFQIKSPDGQIYVWRGGKWNPA